ncbi:MAG: 4a-hydroxytetrahydrobiopterin dehydratase [Pseudomonadota bacterium]
MANIAELLEKKCTPHQTALTAAQIADYLSALSAWSLQDGKIVRKFGFKDYHDTLDFVNAIAHVIHAEDHHPELVVTYNKCVVKFDTHSVNGGRGGISENDFICAAKVDAVFQQSFA